MVPISTVPAPNPGKDRFSSIAAEAGIQLLIGGLKFPAFVLSLEQLRYQDTQLLDFILAAHAITPWFYPEF